MKKFTEKDVADFILSSGLTMDQIFIDKCPYGEMVCYSLQDGREFDLVIESQDFEKSVIDYLRCQGVKVRE